MLAALSCARENAPARLLDRDELLEAARESGAPAAGVTMQDPSGPEAAEIPASPACDEEVSVLEDGEAVRTVCASQAPAHGLTVVDLSDGWAPIIFSEDESLGRAGRQPYRARYIALADEQPRAADGRRVPRDPHLELFGIHPTFRVLRIRALDEERHACHDGVDDSALEWSDTLIPPRASDVAAQRARRDRADEARRALEQAVRSRGASSIHALAEDPVLGRRYAEWRALARDVEAIRAVQGHLACDRLLGRRFQDGVFDYETIAALRIWQRQHMEISSGAIEPHTRALMREDNRELDFRALLRALRERVVDATGLIEDGSALGDHEAVLGRQLDPPELRALARYGPLPNGAPDLISRATEDAARALGWNDPAAAFRALAALGESGTRRLRVAIELPGVPEYHSPHMELYAEIDRGDVWYVAPVGPNGEPRNLPIERRPSLVLYTVYEGERIPLVRWPTTIGGWKREKVGNDVRLVYKGSPVGERVWRDLVVSPSWLPPPTTPDDELVRRRPGGGIVPNDRITGPGYRSAYGLVMLVHHEVRPNGDGEPSFADEGIRTHGSVSYNSILGGYSHGCHRLFNHLAVRMTGFVLRHRDHVRRGALGTDYRRVLEVDGAQATLRVDTRGYFFELTPPIEVNVLEGRVLGPPPRSDTGEARVEAPEAQERDRAGAIEEDDDV